MRSLPSILTSVKLPNFGNVSCFSCFFFLKKRKIWKKKLFDKNGPKKQESWSRLDFLFENGCVPN